MTGVVLFLIATSFMLTYLIMISRVPVVLSNELQAILPNGTVALLAIAGVLLITGCFLDLAPSLLIFTPILYPLALKFGVIRSNWAWSSSWCWPWGLFTPPVGQTLYISALIAGNAHREVSRDIIWAI